MKSNTGRFLLYSLLLSYIEHINAGNLDPLKGCVDPETRTELQASIDALQAAIPSTNTRILTLCKDTKIKFSEHDDRNYIDIDGKEFVLRCDSIETCIIDGGNTGRHAKGSREFVGDGGFLSLNPLVKNRSTLHIEGIKFTNFGVAYNGGVISIFTKGVFNLYLYKCRFTSNYAMFSGGAIFYHGDTDVNTETMIKNCVFKDNTAHLYGGGISFRSRRAQMYIKMRDTDFYGNYAKKNGGGFIVGGATKEQYKVLHMQDCNLKGNKVGLNGGGFFASCSKYSFSTACIIYMKGNKFDRNIASQNGEAYFSYNNNIKLDDNDFNEDSVYEHNSANNRQAYVVYY